MKRMRTWTVGLAVVAFVGGLGMLAVRRVRAAQPAPASVTVRGQSTTQLADGRWLVLGGEGPDGQIAGAALVDPQSGVRTPLTAAMIVPRTDHTATVLADGRVLIVGGRANGAIVGIAEVFDPVSSTFSPLSITGSVARADHSATLLPDGHVLVIGGSDGSPGTAPTEVWTIDAATATATALGAIPRIGHSATLSDDGHVAISGGRRLDGRPDPSTELVDPKTGVATKVLAQRAATPGSEPPPVLAETLPASGASDVSVDTHLSLRFSTAAQFDSLSAGTVTLSGPDGDVTARMVVAEQGRLVFLWPEEPLRDGTTYALSVSGVVGANGAPVVPALVTFTTAAQPADTGASPDPETWVPDLSGAHGWRTDRPASPWEALPPLMAPPGVTAISGRVLTLDGRPLPDVSLSVEGDADTRSDRTGRFLLPLRTAATARRVLRIDGAPASRPNRRYGFFEYGLTVKAGITNILPFTIWQPKLDTAHQVTIPSPTTSEIVVTTPSIPGLELHLPPGTTIIGEDGKPVTRLGITAIPVDRPPFPLAKNVEVPVYFTIQPGGAYVWTAGTGPKGAWLMYPNYHKDLPGKAIQFFHYDPPLKDWFVYGLGHVTANGAQVQPDPTTRLYEFTGAMIGSSPSPPAQAPAPGDCCHTDGDPVDVATGLFTLETTDLYLSDILPIAVTRSYRQRDTDVRPFGVGSTHPYAMFLWSQSNYTQADLVLPDGAKIHYVRTSAGTGFTDAVYVHQETTTTSATPTIFYKSVLSWNGQGWNLTLKDGTVYVFGDVAPLQAIRDRYGNQITVTHANGQTGNITQVTSPSGRWIRFSYDASNRITQAQDHIGRTVIYTYDANGNLATVTDPMNHIISYTYDSAHQLLTVKPPSLQGTQLNLVTNEYTTAADAPTPTGWVKKQTHADGGVFQFAYTFVNGAISRTDVTDPVGNVRRVTFNANGYTLTDTGAYGQTIAQTASNVRQTGSNFVTSYTNTHGDVTSTTYDPKGNVLTVTQLPNTPDQATTTYTYEPVFNQVATTTDPLNHTTTFGYDNLGNRTSVTDALNHKSTFTFNGAGQVTSITDPLQHTTTFAYNGPDLSTTTDPLNRVAQQFADTAGRVTALTDAAGQTTRFVYDGLNHLTQVTDPLGGVTAYGFDTAGRLGSVTDALTHATTYGYDTLDRLASHTDPLSKTETFGYDVNGNPSQRIDRKGQMTTRTYDGLDRLSQITYDDGSTLAYGYDSGNRLTTITDSVNGTITRTYDNRNNLIWNDLLSSRLFSKLGWPSAPQASAYWHTRILVRE